MIVSHIPYLMAHACSILRGFVFAVCQGRVWKTCFALPCLSVTMELVSVGVRAFESIKSNLYVIVKGAANMIIPVRCFTC